MSTSVPPDCAGSSIQAFQSGGADSRNAVAASGAPSSPGRQHAAQLDDLGEVAQHVADHQHAAVRAAAAPIASASSSVRAIGFSSSTCRPRCERALGDRAVQRRRQADVDGVDPAGRGDAASQSVDDLRAERPGDRVGALERAHDAHLRSSAAPRRLRVRAGHEARRRAARRRSRQPVPRERLARRAHRLGHLGQRRPRLAGELDLDRVRAVVAGARRISSTRPKSTWPSPIAGKSQSPLPPRMSLRCMFATRSAIAGRSSSAAHAAVVLDVRGVVVDLHRRVADPVQQRDRAARRWPSGRRGSRARSTRPGRLRGVGERADVGHERGLGLVDVARGRRSRC